MNTETLYTSSCNSWGGRFRRSLLFCCFLLGLFLSAMPRSLAQITGPNVVCSGVSTLFNLTGTPDPSYTYVWTVTPPADATILTATNTSGTIQWVTTSTTTSTITVTITRPSLPTLVWNKTVTVMPAPNPQITTNTIVGCQGVIKDRKDGTDDPKAVAPGGSKGTIIDDGVCLKVCAFSTVEYTVAGGQPGSTFEWSTDLSKGSFAGPSTGPVVNITWSNNLGFTFVKVKETTQSGCVKEKTICIQIIESPQTLFSVNGDIYPSNGNQCFEACIKSNIQFTDLTPPSVSSPLVAWLWDFGDGTYSSIQNPQHVYNSPGNYTVTLTVTNQCGCTKTYKVCIEVNVPDDVPAQISCPSIVCENAIGHYTINNSCPNMFWTVNGGTIVNSTMNSIDILWNNVGASGFGEIIADFSNCGGKCGPKVTATVPVIKANGTIVGKTPACYGKQYKYTLPQWPATNFKWSITSGSATIVGYDENSHEVNVVAYSNFTLHCEYINTLMLCAGQADLTVPVVMPLTLVAPQKVCINSSTSVVTTSPAAGGTTYTFIDPNGNTSYSGSFNVTGVWTVQASNPNFCDVEPISIQVVDPPAPMSSIVGENKVCPNSPYVYEANTAMPNTICNWTVSGGSPATTSGNSATISWSTAPVGIVVTRTWADLPGCSSTSLSYPVSLVSPTMSIGGNFTPCANTSSSYSGAPSVPVDNISWSISPTTAGSVSAGQNTLNPTITWNNTATNVSCTLIATVTKCGYSINVNQPVTVIGTPTISVTPSNANPCSGVPVTFTATTTPPGALITWSTSGTPSGAGPSSAPTFTTTFTNLGLASQNASVTAVVSMSGCPLTGQTTSTVLVKPQPNINMSPGSGSSSTILTCNPVNIPLLLSTNATTTINWYLNSAGSPFLSGSSATSYTATSVGTYRVDVTNSFSCTSSVTRTIALDPGCGAPPCTLPAAAGVGSQNYSIVTCATSTGQAIANVNFNSIYGTYLGSGSGMNILNLSVSGNSTYCTLPAISFASFPNLPINGIQITKPGVYPITLRIGYETSPGVACYKFVTQNVTIPVISDFDYNVNCVTGGYTLTLNEQSPILSGYTSVSTSPLSPWLINGSPVSPGSINLSAYTPGSTLTIVHNIRVSGPLGTFDCARTKQFTVPTPLNPAFTVSTTDPTSPTGSSCAMREVVFTSTNNTGVVKWTWNFGDNPLPTTSFIGTTPSATRTYANPSADYSPVVSLTITDAFGCSASVNGSLQVKRNTLSGGNYVLPEEIRCVGSPSSIQLNGVTGGTPGYSYAWYREQINLGLSANPISVSQNGQYWARVTDVRGCQMAVNPVPAKRAFQPLPDVAIFGAHEYCPNQPITMNAINGTTVGFTYQWQQFSGGWVNIGSATNGIYTIPSGLPAGNYQYRVVVTQALPSPYTSGPCPAISPAFNIIVHPLPNTPYISGPFVLNCADYSLQLNVASPQASVVYNWSNGTSGISTVINHGGPYRVWATNQYGCKNQADIDIPLEPSAYFWRFPHGCYTFCPEQLPRRIDGPSYVPFVSWEWLINGGSLPFPNGPWAGAGSGYVQPLNINTDPSMGGDGNGSGDYQWTLDNGLCKQTTDPMEINITDKCCRMDSKWAYFNCVWPEGASTPTYYAGVYIFGGFDDCKNATYTVYALDPITNLPNGTVTPASGTYSAGSLITFAYNPLPGVTSVKFRIVVNCDGKECMAELEPRHLREIDCTHPHECDIARELRYFRCIWPKGAAAPTFMASMYISNPYGCSATTYILSAVDPVTGLPNGSITPSTGTVSPGWSPIDFTYTPNPGVTAVRITITMICDGMVCTTELGTFEGLDDRKRYPCSEGKGKATAKAVSEGLTKMSIAPNPASDNVKIGYEISNWNDADLYQIAVVNMLGQSVANYTITGAQGAWQYATQQLNSGTYLVRLIKNGKNIDVQHMLIIH